MCTVTFLPVKRREHILTSNRDEDVMRAPAVFPSRNDGILFPRDGHAGGTWIAASANGKSICLLNGAFEKHKHKPPYRKSRGIIVLEAFEFSEFETFASKIDLNKIEPFTMVMFQQTKRPRLYEFRWDGNQKYFTPLEPDKPYFWCSATLYPPEIYQKRKQWFDAWMKNHDFTLDNILHFHQYAGEGDPADDLVIDRGGILKTLSISSIHHKEDRSYMVYIDLHKGVTFQELI